MALGWLWWRALVLDAAPGRHGCWRGRHGTWRHLSSFYVAGVVFAPNLLTRNLSSYHVLTHNLSSHNLLWRGRCGTYGTGLALVARLVLGVAPDAAAVGVAGVAFADIHLRFMWQAWYLVTSTGMYLCCITYTLRILWHFWSGWNCHTYIICNHLTPYIYVSIHPSIHPSVYSFIHTYIYAYIHVYIIICPYTIYSYLFFYIHTTCSTQSFTISFPFLLSPCHLYLSFAACWKKIDMWGYLIL